MSKRTFRRSGSVIVTTKRFRGRRASFSHLLEGNGDVLTIDVTSGQRKTSEARVFSPLFDRSPTLFIVWQLDWDGSLIDVGLRTPFFEVAYQAMKVYAPKDGSKAFDSKNRFTPATIAQFNKCALYFAKLEKAKKKPLPARTLVRLNNPTGPKTKTVWPRVLCSITPDNDRATLADMRRWYIDNYVPLVRDTPLFARMREHVARGGALVLVDYDGPRTPAGEPTAVLATESTLRAKLADESAVFGHAYVIAAALQCFEL